MMPPLWMVVIVAIVIANQWFNARAQKKLEATRDDMQKRIDLYKLIENRWQPGDERFVTYYTGRGVSVRREVLRFDMEGTIADFNKDDEPLAKELVATLNTRAVQTHKAPGMRGPNARTA